MNTYLNIAIQAARAGAKVLLQSMDRIDRLTITEKSAFDFVSNADLMSEAAIIEILQKYYPDIPILSEEAGEISAKDKNYKWILDPLDGTSNYLRQIPHFAISLALQQDGKTVISLVYDPVKDEMFTACKGHGAFCNNNRIRIKECQKIEHAYVGLGGPKYHSKDYQDSFHEIATRLMQRSASTRRLGSAALDLCYLAAGRLDAYWGVNLSTWDTAAAVLIAKEAGALVTDFYGKASASYSEIIAASPKVLHGMVELCQPLIGENNNE